ncbi:putative hydrolase, alpha/beta fold protein [Mycobacterium parmense]|uniref:Putative hydrolase, alpha/beta fold protein n=1 Tax=Mycobacterium parmense TaxID=185642 RepID=A0A7I7Z462_9MYCO|nr:putative hydrolase, alpha/beta fold protein [Mycobacterium parmense]
MPTVERVQVDTALGEICVHIDGSGEAILFWPSLLMTGDMWAGQSDHFADRHRVVLIDPPGHGGSQKLTATFTFEKCAQCIVDILDHLGIGSAHFVGNSWGGMIGGTFAALHPDRVRRAVLMNCTASVAGARQKVEYAIMLRMARLLGGIKPPLTRSVLKSFLGPTTFRTRPDVVAYVRTRVTGNDVASCSWAVRSVVPLRPDQHALLARVTTPVLVVAGAEDTTFPNHETKAMADAIPGATFVVLDGVAHLAALEDPALINALVEDFLAE